MTLSSPELDQDVAYSIYVNDILQEYSGTLSSWETGPDNMRNMGGRTDAAMMELPDGIDEWLESDTEIPDDIHT